MLIEKLNGIIFDLDNTLVKTNGGYFYEVIKNILNEIGYKKNVATEEVFRFWYGIDRDKEIKKMWDIDPKIFWPVLRKYDTIEGRLANTSVFDDVCVLKKLDGRIRKGIFTSSIEEIALGERKLVEPYLNIDCFVVANVFEGIKSKPEPDGIHKCLELLGVKSNETAMVGDSALDVVAAQRANVLDIFIQRENSNIGKSRPSVIIPDLYGLFWL